jgi:2-haloalkanoic acid dehalogenase type II
MARYEVVTFDCYGTLIDWESGISGAFEQAARDDGVSIRREEILRAYALVEPVVEREGYRCYREVLGESAIRVAHMLGWRLENAAFLAESLPSWKPFPDTNPALQRLVQAGIRLGILSNIDDDLLAATRKHFLVDFEIIVTAQQVRSYKPAAPHFRTAKERIGSARWLHAAQSDFHDIVPANQLGIPNAWINRRAQTALPGGTPMYEFPDLTRFAETITRT